MKTKMPKTKLSKLATKKVNSIICKGRTRQQIRQWWFTKKKHLGNESPVDLIFDNPGKVIAYANTLKVAR